ncbi:putative surface protein [Gardnerella vaginalis 1400E]|uniref:Putative surface protein n=1 Tax=Gardnerella vaginalis 1400E TaxID=698956 RepID=I4LV43_GARVA|nr:SpaH/EbpB family LPXTG-anchored major pilin [Gardnerella vaginalis]EIK80833.1 putative surface protein [Gardnerella vaginalis 1400E]
MNKFTKQCVAAVASLAMAGTLCVAGAVVAGSSAWAAPSVDTTFNTKGKTGLTTDSQDGNYQKAPWLDNAPSTGSITIYKWKSETDGTTGNQLKKTPVKDAEFTIKKVKSVNSKDLDLTKYDSWVEIAKAADGLNKNTGTVTFDDKFGTDQKLSGSTNDNGVLRFKDLPLGLYQVQETKAPKGYSAAETRPFYMTLPMIQQVKQETKYNYAPFVDPKNVDISDSVQKTKDTKKTVGAGDEISYTITADLDKVKAKDTDPNRVADEFKGYSVFDLAPANYFESYDNVAKTVKAGSTTLTPMTDYLVSAAEAKDGKKKIEITFTDKGREALATAANGSVGKAAKVTVDLTFKLAKTATLSTNSVTNEGGMVPSHDTGTTPSEVKTKTNPKVDFATFQIKKVSSKDNSALPGAKFMLFANKDEATACTNAIKEGKTSTELDKVCKAKASVGFGEKETSSEEGADKKGLTEAYSVKRGEDFYAVETVAPAGYIRNPDVKTINVEEKDSTKVFPVENLPASGNDGKSWLFNLPKTGAAGVIIFALAGVCLVAVGMFIFLRNRKKEEEQQAA